MMGLVSETLTLSLWETSGVKKAKNIRTLGRGPGTVFTKQTYVFKDS